MSPSTGTHPLILFHGTLLRFNVAAVSAKQCGELRTGGMSHQEDPVRDHHRERAMFACTQPTDLRTSRTIVRPWSREEQSDSSRAQTRSLFRQTPPAYDPLRSCFPASIRRHEPTQRPASSIQLEAHKYRASGVRSLARRRRCRVAREVSAQTPKKQGRWPHAASSRVNLFIRWLPILRLRPPHPSQSLSRIRLQAPDM